MTFRLTGTLPREVLLRLKSEREAIIQQALAAKRPLTWAEQRELFNWYSDRVDKQLDAGTGDCWLREPEVAKLVADALRHFEGERYELRAWTIMPNHVHVVVMPTTVAIAEPERCGRNGGGAEFIPQKGPLSTAVHALCRGVAIQHR